MPCHVEIYHVSYDTLNVFLMVNSKFFKRLILSINQSLKKKQEKLSFHLENYQLTRPMKNHLKFLDFLGWDGRTCYRGRNTSN